MLFFSIFFEKKLQIRQCENTISKITELLLKRTIELKRQFFHILYEFNTIVNNVCNIYICLDHVKGTGIEIMVIAIDVIAVDVTDLQDVVGRDQDRDQEKGKEEIETGTDLIEIEVEIELQTGMEIQNLL